MLTPWVKEPKEMVKLKQKVQQKVSLKIFASRKIHKVLGSFKAHSHQNLPRSRRTNTCHCLATPSGHQDNELDQVEWMMPPLWHLALTRETLHILQSSSDSAIPCLVRPDCPGLDRSRSPS